MFKFYIIYCLKCCFSNSVIVLVCEFLIVFCCDKSFLARIFSYAPKEKFEDTKALSETIISKKDRQHNR